MKLPITLISLAMAVFASCGQQPTDSQVYTPETTTPMELTTFETIRLEKPSADGGDALLRTMWNRRSDREFAVENLSLKHLSEILWSAYGINREDGKRTVPSAVALYPLDVYAFLANGVYRYDPAAHELLPVVEGDHRALAGQQPFVQGAPLNLVFIADFGKYGRLPQERWVQMASLDAGHCTQNIYLYCASEGLKTVVRGGAPEAQILELLELGENHQFIVAQTVGY